MSYHRVMDHEKPEAVSPPPFVNDFSIEPSDDLDARHGQNLYIDDEAQVEEKRERRGEKVWYECDEQIEPASLVYAYSFDFLQASAQ